MSIRGLGLSGCIVDRSEQLDIDMCRIRDGEATIMRQIKRTEKVIAMSMEPEHDYEEVRAATYYR